MSENQLSDTANIYYWKIKNWDTREFPFCLKCMDYHFGDKCIYNLTISKGLTGDIACDWLEVTG